LLIFRKKSENHDTRGDFYWKLDTVSKRVKEFVDLMGSKYDIKWLNRNKNGLNGSTLRPVSAEVILQPNKKESFLDELKTYKDITSLKRMLTNIQSKKQKYSALKLLSQKYSDDIRYKQLLQSLEKLKLVICL
jgi:hypothetical protein